jgi:selenocysteine lyase/cysteine desulfurase
MALGRTRNTEARIMSPRKQHTQPLMEAFDVAATARASLAPYNTEADIDAFLDGLEHTLRRLR